MNQDHGLLSGASTSAILIVGNGGSKHFDVRIGSGSTVYSWYLPSNGALTTGKTYQLSVELDSYYNERVWLDGVSLSLGSYSSGVYAVQASSGSWVLENITRLGSQYVQGSVGFQGYIYDVRVGSGSDYPMSLNPGSYVGTDGTGISDNQKNTQVPITPSSFTGRSNNLFLFTPSTVLPNFITTTAASTSAGVTTFTGANILKVGEVISLTGSSNTSYQFNSLPILSATATSFSVNLTTSGSYTGFARAFTNGTFYDDTGSTAMAWSSGGNCEDAARSPIFTAQVAYTTTTPVLTLGGSQNMVNKMAQYTITAVTGSNAGLVTFYYNNRLITGCKNVTTSGTAPNIQATCLWKPIVHGSTYLSATVTPSDPTHYSSATGSSNITVIKRVVAR
jgi:hypothetical protein